MGVFDEIALRYDTPERAQVAETIAAEIRRQLGDVPGQSAIDYGCGTGLVGLPLAGFFRALLMVDASPNMVEVVRQKIEAAHLQNVSALCADFAEKVPPGLAADVVIAAQVLLHIPNTENILRQLYAVLSPGGRLLIVDFDKNEAVWHEKVHNGFVQAELIAQAKRAGFADACAHTFFRGQRLFMDQDASLFLLSAQK
ncbi:MAG: class I SAM-dependent methyltransferase [Oscillospiraceae bacterium]